MRSTRNKVPRYDDGSSNFESSCNLQIFQYPGRCFSRQEYRDFTREEYKAAFLYILTNITEMDTFFEYVFLIKFTYWCLFFLVFTNLLTSPRTFDKEQWKSRITPTEKQLRELRLNGWKYSRVSTSGPNFFDWFKTQVMFTNTPNISPYHMNTFELINNIICAVHEEI